MIQRDITKELFRQLKEYPIITVLGPRQAGKTTLVRELLSDYDYVNLENPETRQFAIDDPKAFLRQFKSKVIFDEVQRTPHLLSYIQGIVDESKNNGQFILTGSHQLELKAAITQSLAGRTGILNLLPLSISEMGKVGISFMSVEDYIFNFVYDSLIVVFFQSKNKDNYQKKAGVPYTLWILDSIQCRIL
jgi:predicted AAA+ superfamily ATPase